MSSIGVVVFRNSPLGRTQVLQESMNNCLNISNNEIDCNGKRDVLIVRKKHKLQSPSSTSVSALVNENVNSASVKRPRVRDDTSDDSNRTPTPIAVARRNARERNRVRQVNDGFAALRRHIPEEVAAAFENANSNRGPNKKLSKVETLRMAVEYIRNLETLLNIGHGTDKENNTHPSMESFPSPASSSPRENSQERSYFSMNSPALDDDLDEDELENSMLLQHQHYMGISTADSFHLVSTPHLYEEDEGQPLTPCSDLLAQDDVNSHLLEENFRFPNSAEQFTVIPEQSYCSESDAVTNENEFEVKYAESIHSQLNNYSSDIQLSAMNSDLLLVQEQYKFKEESIDFPEDKPYSKIDLKKELPDIHVTPEDREQFEETLKWWQEKTRQNRTSNKRSDS